MAEHPVGRERYVVVGLAHARAAWFGEVARWATAGAAPIEFVKAVSVEEVRARLRSGRVFSAVLLDAAVAGVDRDLADLARTNGCAVLIVDDGRATRDWSGLGATAVLPAPLTRADLLGALGAHATPVGRGEAVAVVTPDAAVPPWHGSLVAVTGVPGAGTSVVAAALAQGLADDPRDRGMVVLADLALDADQAVLHDAGDIIPGFPELVDAHRLGTPPIEEVRGLTFAVTDRGHAILLGLRRHRDWAALRSPSVQASLEGLRRAYRVVVADISPDLEGEEQCGSSEVEDRNLLARTVAGAASVVVVVAQPGPTRLHRLIRLLGALLDHGVAASRILIVVNRAPRSPRARAGITRAVAELTHGSFGSPIFLPERRKLDDVIRDGSRLPAALTNPMTTTVRVLLDRDEPVSRPGPVAVQPGSLPTWTDG